MTQLHETYEREVISHEVSEKEIQTQGNSSQSLKIITGLRLMLYVRLNHSLTKEISTR